MEKCTISQVDPAGGKSQEFFDVVRYEKYCDEFPFLVLTGELNFFTPVLFCINCLTRNFLSRRSELKGRQWTVLDIAHSLQNDDVSCGVYVLKVIPICLN